MWQSLEKCLVIVLPFIEDQNFVVLAFFSLLLIQHFCHIHNVNHTLHKNLSHLYQLLKYCPTKYCPFFEEQSKNFQTYRWLIKWPLIPNMTVILGQDHWYRIDRYLKFNPKWPLFNALINYRSFSLGRIPKWPSDYHNDRYEIPKWPLFKMTVVQNNRYYILQWPLFCTKWTFFSFFNNGHFWQIKMTVNSKKIPTKLTVILIQNDLLTTKMTTITQNDLYWRSQQQKLTIIFGIQWCWWHRYVGHIFKIVVKKQGC